MWNSSRRCSCSPDNMPRRTSVCRKSDMRCPRRDKRSVLSDVSCEGSAIIRPGEVDTPLLEATPDGGRTRWILIPCAWTVVGLLCAVQEIAVAKVHGGHVSWVFVGTIELVYWNVWAAFTPLVFALAKRFP